MRLSEKPRTFIRVIPQSTTRPGIVSLVAEESIKPFEKGALVMQCQRTDVYNVIKPLQCEILLRKDKARQDKYITKMVTPENAPDLITPSTKKL